ncbi:H+-transporting ATPase [Methanolobus vulcani]|jgi:H+-transporting ATPase|uniref:H+-transporting ATPase n=1 Tax=Methanolobus vulcani TaxID=38026 RepID=A0A7Z7AYQ8_9EURY|nr:plasma-membrane proton-efflux P-type ATPase [Methanolobus vulcani]MDK2825305.1 H+-transporting ATPase [Methanolobus sp.]MDK2947883.1 H+-transporting ATPase [Methanolobus sp.]SDG28837.1 H+-transporting ATPase [Methanolobus vulcani]
MKETETSGITNAKDLSVDELFTKLGSTSKGIKDSDVQGRLEQYGYNELLEKKTSPFIKFIGYFWGPIPWMIEIAALLSAFIQRWEDFAIISILLILNGVVGFWQENKADNAIELLKNKMALRARVLRDGKWITLPARELVPGDVIRLRSGDIVPADVKLFDGDYLQIDESALTGESLPADKGINDIGFSGSIIQKGEMNGLVFATGMDTYFGKTTKLLTNVKTQSHFQKAIIKIGDYLIVLAAILVAVVFIVAVFRQESLVETLQFALVLVVAAIPAALPAVLSVSMAVGATNLAGKGAIVSKLVSIEEMAGMDVLCSDKTGTITKNELTLSDMIPFGYYTTEDLLIYSALASREEDNDPIDNAVLRKIATLDGVQEKTAGYNVLNFKPFDPVIKHTEASIESSDGRKFKVAKGAPQVLLDMAINKDSIKDDVEEKVNVLASKGYRPLGVGVCEGNECHFAGLIGLYDPPHEDSAETIDTAVSMGVDVKMITGDHAAIAKEIASQIGLGTNITTASELEDKTDIQAQEVVDKADGFAQVFPEHKYRIVELLQDDGHIVGMTGDGVNDAPALKKADAGIAVAGATDAARSAADIVFTAPGLSTIIDSIKESRKIFQRMKSYSIYRIAETVRVLFFIATSIIAFNFYPVTAIMIVLLALFNDAPIMAIAYDNVNYSPFPEKWNIREVISMATFLGIIGVISSFTIFYIGLNVLNLNQDVLQSFIFLKLAVAGHLTIFVARTRGPFWSIKPSGILFWSTIGTKFLATLVVVYGFYISPIGWKLAGIVWLYALVAFVITDLIKVRLYHLLDHKGIIFQR